LGERVEENEQDKLSIHHAAQGIEKMLDGKLSFQSLSTQGRVA
jgi:hypothetical protein